MAFQNFEEVWAALGRLYSNITRLEESQQRAAAQHAEQLAQAVAKHAEQIAQVTERIDRVTERIDRLTSTVATLASISLSCSFAHSCTLSFVVVCFSVAISVSSFGPPLQAANN